jgi:hypothetical protein
LFIRQVCVVRRAHVVLRTKGHINLYRAQHGGT